MIDAWGECFEMSDATFGVWETEGDDDDNDDDTNDDYHHDEGGSGGSGGGGGGDEDREGDSGRASTRRLRSSSAVPHRMPAPVPIPQWRPKTGRRGGKGGEGKEESVASGAGEQVVVPGASRRRSTGRRVDPSPDCE